MVFLGSREAGKVGGDVQKAAVLDRAKAYEKRSAVLLSEESSGPVPRSAFATI